MGLFECSEAGQAVLIDALPAEPVAFAVNAFVVLDWPEEDFWRLCGLEPT